MDPAHDQEPLYREWLPHPALRLWVRCYWRLEDPRPGDETIFPDGSFEIVLHYGGTTSHLDTAGRPARQPRALLIGEVQRPVRLASPHGVACVGIRFRAGGIAPFLPVDIGEIVHGIHDLRDVFSGRAAPGIGAWVERILEADDDAKVRLLDRLLLQRLADSDAAGSARDLRLLHTSGASTVEEMAHRAGLSTRQLQRRLTRILGIPPKRMQRVLRFHGALQALLAGDLGHALDAYYDQSHLLRDFRDFTGSTPTRIVGHSLDLNRMFHGRSARPSS